MHKVLALLLALVTPLSAVAIRVASFNVGAYFTESSGGIYYPLYGLGAAGTPDHDSVRAILGRIDADVVALQEIDSADAAGSPSDVQVLAASLGYPHVYIAPVGAAGTFKAPFDPDLRVAVISRYPFLNSGAIRSPEDMRELTRLHAVVKVDVPGTPNDPVLVTAHLKSGDGIDRFRRAVEMKRLAKHLNVLGLTEDDNFIITGDFNLNPNYGGTAYHSPPAGLPSSYTLGPDIPFPVSYSVNPLAYFTAPGIARLDPRQLNGSAVTFPGGAGYTLDLMLVSPAIAGRVPDSEVYNSALDTSNGGGLPKAGQPLAAGTSATASDHFAIFADLELDDRFEPYPFGAAGQTVVEDFVGFGGGRDPAAWLTAGGGPWQGADTGGSAVPGWRAYGGPADPALGFLPSGAPGTATAVFVNRSALPLTALEIASDVEQWRAALGGTADRLDAELIVDGRTTPLPGLFHLASTRLPSGAVAGGLTTAKTARVQGLAIAPGASFELRFTFTPGSGGGVAPAEVFLNEFHYDDVDADGGEFIEIAVAPGFDQALSTIDVVLYNGESAASATVYGTLNLGADFMFAGAYDGYRIFSAELPVNGLQNGPRDGFAIVDKTTSEVLQLLSYEGAFTAAGGPAAGMTSIPIGVSESGTTAENSSLGLSGSGGVAGDFTWAVSSGSNTKGAANAGQTFVLPAPPPQGLAIDNLRVTAFSDPDADGDGIPDPLDADDDNDGQPDADEIAFGTDPLDPASIFRPVLAPSVMPSNGFALSFPGAAGITYAVESSTTLEAWDELSTHVGSGGEIIVPLPLAGPARFYRVRAGE
jgi:endonuclease/exonuclease/phosphatase family metal-dependent hydrolase